MFDYKYKATEIYILLQNDVIRILVLQIAKYLGVSMKIKYKNIKPLNL